MIRGAGRHLKAPCGCPDANDTYAGVCWGWCKTAARRMAARRLRFYGDEPACCDRHDGWVCNLPPGHPGRHEAHGPRGGEPYAVWGDVVRDGRHLMLQEEPLVGVVLSVADINSLIRSGQLCPSEERVR